MGKVLNKVPIAGSVVKFGGLELVAERSTGRRNRIGTVIVTAIHDDHEESEHDDDQRVDAATRLASESAVKV
jgi:hypothetical protein